MSIVQEIPSPGGQWPELWEMPADLREDDDAFEESLLEARACGDAGFVDRMWSSWWPEFDESGHDESELDGEDVGADAGGDAGWVPADPMERFGRAPFLRLAGRAKNHADAAFLAAVHQTGHAEGRYDRAGHPQRDRFALPEIGMTLGHSTAMAGYQLSLAEAVIERLPRLHAAMAAGWLDLATAKVFVTETAGMPDDLAAMVVAGLLPVAASVTNTTLSERISIAAGQLDPEWVRRREQAAHARARVEYVGNPAGTGEVALRDITVEARARIQARGDALAHELRRAARTQDCGWGCRPCGRWPPSVCLTAVTSASMTMRCCAR